MNKASALTQFGAVLQAIGEGRAWPGHAIGLSGAEYAALDDTVKQAQRHNGWSTEEQVRFALRAWGESLTADAIVTWIDGYPARKTAPSLVRTVGLVLAGNVPLVGLHDVICVWLSGHRAAVKLSSQEPELLPALVAVLDHFAPGTAERIQFTTGRLGPIDAVIATGSDNTARYFEHYFGHLPRIVRKNRVSIAVLDGSETEDELTALGEDVFRYFGLGCRNVSKLFLPRDFDVDRVFKAFFPWKDIVHHNKYGNNYDYTRALWLLDSVSFLENGFLLLKDDEAIASPVSTLFVERYDDASGLGSRLESQRAKIQCIVGHGRTPFGNAQHPALWDYADGVDTMEFLVGLE